MKPLYRCAPVYVVSLLVGQLAPSVALGDVELLVLPPEVPGVTCAMLAYDCHDPEAVQILIDNNVVLDYVAGNDAFSIPRAPCFNESDFGSGTHTLAVEATCGGIDTDDSSSVSFANPPVGLVGVEHTQFEWTAGQTALILVHAQEEDLDIEVDFGEVDTDYVLGSETVVDRGNGLYEVSYTFHRQTSRPPANIACQLPSRPRPASLGPIGTLSPSDTRLSARAPSPFRTNWAANST
ncbi:hypothetical protein [Nannocystis pusilla]|uniref:hypothetical protein n=1 Tax=Nannocystis pusilla TaxID=889268 RepID=UPI003B7A6284